MINTSKGGRPIHIRDVFRQPPQGCHRLHVEYSTYPTNGSIFEGAKGSFTITTANPTERSVESSLCKLFKKIKRDSKKGISRTQKSQDLNTTWWDTHQQQISIAWYVVTCRGNFQLLPPSLKMSTQSLAPTSDPSAEKQ